MGAGGSVVEGQLVDDAGSENDENELMECQDPRGPGEGAGHSQASPRPCRDFLKGNCKYGDRCRYSHENTGSEPAEKRPCKEFLKGHCKYGDRCRYSHEPGGSPGDRAHVPCRNFEKGFCAFGDRCRYGHDGAGGGGPSVIDIPLNTVAEEDKREQLSYEEAEQLLDSAFEQSTKRLEALEPQRTELTNEVQAMEPEERTKSLGTVWQYAGRGGGKGRGKGEMLLLLATDWNDT
eukprot:s612_g27.t1